MNETKIAPTKASRKVVSVKKPTAWKSRKLFGFNDTPGFECQTLDGQKRVIACGVCTSRSTDAKGLRTLAEKLLSAAAWLEAK